MSRRSRLRRAAKKELRTLRAREIGLREERALIEAKIAGSYDDLALMMLDMGIDKHRDFMRHLDPDEREIVYARADELSNSLSEEQLDARTIDMISRVLVPPWRVEVAELIDDVLKADPTDAAKKIEIHSRAGRLTDLSRLQQLAASADTEAVDLIERLDAALARYDPEGMAAANKLVATREAASEITVSDGEAFLGRPTGRED